MKVHFATTNKGKVITVGHILSIYNIEVAHADIELPEPRTEDLERIAREKVKFAYKELNSPCFALDAGFYIYSLGGFPGSYVNPFLKNPALGLKGILKLVAGEKRECGFRNSLAYLDAEEKEPVIFSSSIEGRLAEEPRGKMQDYSWSELHLLFIPDGYSQTLAEMNREEYMKWRTVRQPDSVASVFGKWLSEKKLNHKPQ